MGSKPKSIMLVVAGGLLGVLLLQSASFAHDWTHSHYLSRSGGRDGASAYTDSDSNNDRAFPWKSDFAYAFMRVRACGSCQDLRAVSSVCGPVTDACERTQTQWVYLSTGPTRYYVSYHCGHDNRSDGKHSFGSSDAYWQPCSQQGDRLDIHEKNF